MTSWHSYPKIWNLGHKQLADLFKDPVVLQEKIDGSFFAFGVYCGQLKWRSKAVEMTTDKQFAPAVTYIKSIEHLLKPEHMYCGEYLKSPGHNTQLYGRVPNNHIILFDVKRADEDYFTVEEAAVEAERLGLEFVPYEIMEGDKVTELVLKDFMDRHSILGGEKKPEGVVIKNYKRFGIDKKCLMGKFVSEAFKESHRAEWKVKNPLQGDVLHAILLAYTTEARWQKALGYLRDSGSLTDSPKDIGPLVKRIQQDVKDECKEEILEALYKWAWPKIERGVTNGAPQWYKEQLLARQFANDEAVQVVGELVS